MKRFSVLLSVVIVLAAAGCAAPTTTPCPTVACAPCPPMEQPVCVQSQAVEKSLIGLWTLSFGDDLPVEVLTISDTSLYWVENDPGMGDAASNTRESYYQILESDPAAGHLKLKLMWVRHNGRPGGFDSSIVFLTYVVENDQLRLAVARGDELTYPAAPQSKAYTRR